MFHTGPRQSARSRQPNPSFSRNNARCPFVRSRRRILEGDQGPDRRYHSSDQAGDRVWVLHHRVRQARELLSVGTTLLATMTDFSLGTRTAKYLILDIDTTIMNYENKLRELKTAFLEGVAVQTEITVVRMMNVVQHAGRFKALKLQSDVHGPGIQRKLSSLTTCRMRAALGSS